MKNSKIFYRISTLLVLLFVGLGSFADILKIQPVVEGFRHVQFPEYMLPFFGVAKLCGSIAILFRSQEKLVEWAYAGIILYFIGAIYVHLAMGDGIDKTGVPLFILLAAVTSCVFSRRMRTDRVVPATR